MGVGGTTSKPLPSLADEVGPGSADTSGFGAMTIASMGLQIMGGLFGYFGSLQARQTAESRARMVVDEMEADAQRYSEEARQFKARQAVAYVKSGVELTGTPLDILDETERIASENLSAMRARGRALAQDVRTEGVAAELAGRAQLIGGVVGAGQSALWYNFASGRVESASKPRPRGVR